MKTKHSIFYPLAGEIGVGALLLLGASAPAQNLFVADYGSGNVYEFTPDGTPFVFATGLKPTVLAFNDAGDLYVVSETNIYQFTPGGTQTVFASGAGPLGYPSLACDKAGDVFFGDAVSGTITEFTPDGAPDIFATGYGVTSLAVNRANHLFEADDQAASIFQFTRDDGESTFASELNWPMSLAFNKEGDLFVSQLSGNIIEITPEGTQSIFASVNSALSDPMGEAVNNAGDLYVSEFNSDVILKITPEGTQSFFAWDLDLPWGMAFAPKVTDGETVYVGNPALPFKNYAQPDGAPPLVIMGEYSPAGPLPDTAQPLPKGIVQDVKFYGQNYDFTLYALHRVSAGLNANEQTFKVVAAEHFSGFNNAPGAITLAVSNFQVKKGDFLAFSGIGPWYPQQPNDALNTDATYEDAVQLDPINDNDTATPPTLGEIFSVGVNRDAGATYGYVDDNFGNQGRIYAIGVDVKRDLQNHHDRHP